MTLMTSPRWKTNYERTADLRQLNLPCHRINFLRCPNSLRLKSEANEACIPSFPSIPIPTSASRIIPTSLPPSPTAAIRLPVYFLINIATYAFYVGEHLQTQTQGALVATLKNSVAKSSYWKIVSKVLPSIISVVFFMNLLSYLILSRQSLQFEISLMKYKSLSLDFSPELIAIEVAVSTLSPVSIHI